jgi:hypothetical protein
MKENNVIAVHDFYLAHEESVTGGMRWVQRADERVLQQQYQLRNMMAIRYEWRDVPVAIEDNP